MNDSVRYAVSDQPKLQQARALIGIIHPEMRDMPQDAIYRRLAALGWVWRGDGWYVAVNRKNGV